MLLVFNFADVDATVKFPIGFFFTFFSLNNIRIIVTVLESEERLEVAVLH